MKHKDIIVGKKYKHRDFPNTIYLGIGHYNTNTGNYSGKNLVIIDDEDKSWVMGHIVAKHTSWVPTNEFWDGFYEMEIDYS